MFKKAVLATACTAALGGLSVPANAADWLMIQGTEPAGQAPRAKVWGFIQAQYQKDSSDPNGSDAYIPPKLIGPDLDTQSQFNVNRARIGVRGTGFPLDTDVNYFFLVEFGNNAITNPGSAFAKITDASVTFNQFKDVTRVRVGTFKIPMAEEIYQGIALFDYVNFTAGTNQLMLERLPNRSYTANNSATTLPPQTAVNGFTESVDAARDTGIQFFNTINMANNWQVGYSLMYGNGNGLNAGDNDDNKDTHVYFNVTKVFKGKGPRRQDWKTFAWYTNGKRSYDGNNDGVAEEYTRKRYGIGTKYYKLPFRVTAEWMKGKGMIFQGPDKPSFGLVPPSQGNPSHAFNGLRNDATATSWYIEAGYYIPKTKWEIDLRYARFNRMDDGATASFGPFTNVTAEIEFTGLTFGVQYHFNKKTRVAFNYERNSAEALSFASGAGPNANLDGVGNRIAAQVTHIF
jgi:hypothetical protein